MPGKLFERPTPETFARARAGLVLKRLAGAKLRRNFLDAPEWDRLAAQRGLRLPQWHQVPERRLMRRWLGKLGITITAYRAWYGGGSLDSFHERNPDWPLRAWVGLLLEQLDAHGGL